MNATNAITSADFPKVFAKLSKVRQFQDALFEAIAASNKPGNSNKAQFLEKIRARRQKLRQEIGKGVLFQDDVATALDFLKVYGEDSELRLICGLSYWVSKDHWPAAEEQLRLSHEPAAGLALKLLKAQADLEPVQKSPYVCAVLGDAYLYGIGVEWNLQLALKHYLEALDSAPILVARRLAITYDALGYTDQAQRFYTYIGHALSSETSCSSENSTDSTS